MSLNPEPADPQERQEHRLPPKSYADAAEEALETNGQDGDSFNEDSIKESPPMRRLVRKGSIEPRPLGEMLDEEEAQPSLPSTPVQPRRSRSKKEGKSYADAAEEGVNTDAHPIIDLHEGDGEGNNEKGNGNNGGEFTGEGQDASPKSPAKIGRPHKRTSSRPTNQKKAVAEGLGGLQQKLVYERFESPDGKQLTSVKPDDSYENALRIDEKEMPQKEQQQNDDKPSRDELVSGRRAGASWERSAYVLSCRSCGAS